MTDAGSHAPRSRDEIVAASRELASRGLTARDIASILGIAPAQVEQILGHNVRKAVSQRREGQQ